MREHEAGPRGRVALTEPFPSALLSPRNPPSSSQNEQNLCLCESALMSHSHSTAAPSSNSQRIINNALKTYEKCTKQDLLSHPLASRLQVCNSSATILTVLRQQVEGLDQSRSSDDRLTKWLTPTVKVLYTFSTTLEERAGLVSLKI